MAVNSAGGLLLHEDSRLSTRRYGRDYVRGRKRGEIGEEGAYPPEAVPALPALGNPSPALQIQSQPVNSAKQITAQTIAREYRQHHDAP